MALLLWDLKIPIDLLLDSIIAVSVPKKLSLVLSALQIAALCICKPVIVTLPKSLSLRTSKSGSGHLKVRTLSSYSRLALHSSLVVGKPLAL